jgi:hypothetical protein
MLYVVATFQSRCLAAFFPQGLIAVRYKALVRFESVCSSRGTAHYFDEVIWPHWLWLVDSIVSYFDMHAFSAYLLTTPLGYVHFCTRRSAATYAPARRFSLRISLHFYT